MTRLLIVAVLSAAALAQEKKTEAEELFEKAWWEETASGALDKALEGYKKAAEADGPAAIRARSLYRGAIVEQRLGRTDRAVALLERLARDFPGETDLLKEAKARLQEWTAVDLRKSFSEWYRSYVFSPEFQARVVDLVLRMGTAQPTESSEAWNQLLTIGEASVPALQEALKSSNEQLCHKATQLLFDLGVVPPTEALVKYPAWMRDDEAWLTLYGADEATRKRVREEATGDAPTVRAVRAVATSPEEVLAFVLAEPERKRLLVLLTQHSGEAMRKRVMGLIQEPTVPAHVIDFLRDQFPLGPDDADLRRCLEWTKSLPTASARRAAAGWAAARLTDKSEGDLDAVLALVPDPSEAIFSDLAVPVLKALVERRRGAELSWTPARVGVLLDLYTRAEATARPWPNFVTGDRLNDALYFLNQVVSNLRTDERGAYALADALLDRASRLRGTGPNQPRLAMYALAGVDTLIGGSPMLSWGDIFSERLSARWSKASPKDKTTLLELATHSQGARDRILKTEADALRKEAVARDTDPELQIAIVSLLGRVLVSDFLACFELSKAEDAQAAVERLERFANSLTRDERTVASMREILIHGKSQVRRRALELLLSWNIANDAQLLPAAKDLVTDEAPVVRLWAVNQLCAWNSFDASPYLVKALEDPDDDIRATAAAGLARVGRADALPALVKLLDDPNPAVRDSALAAMEQIRKIVELKKTWQLEQAGFK